MQKIPSVKMRQHWWQFWLPKYSWLQVQGKATVLTDNDVEPGDMLTVNNSGRVVKAKSRAEYEPNITTDGGRVVRTVPKGLRKIKEAQNDAS